MAKTLRTSGNENKEEKMLRYPLTLVALMLAGCSTDNATAPQEAATAANTKCPNVHIDKMATDWIVSTGDPKNRMRILETEAGYKKHG